MTENEKCFRILPQNLPKNNFFLSTFDRFSLLNGGRSRYGPAKAEGRQGRVYI
jgi:hypothetical protein